MEPEGFSGLLLFSNHIFKETRVYFTRLRTTQMIPSIHTTKKHRLRLRFGAYTHYGCRLFQRIKYFITIILWDILRVAAAHWTETFPPIVGRS